jgi:4-amino-4-deoxy-L-arabinose transferase-like glycosyltransferase
VGSAIGAVVRPRGAALQAGVSRLAISRPRLLLVAFCLLCWLPGFFTIPATDRDEARFVQATKQMLESGDFVDIRNGDEPRNRKPIGIYWLQAPFAAAAGALGLGRGNPVWPYRLASLLGGLLAVLATEALGRTLFGPQAGLLAGAMLGGCALLTVEAHIAKTDAALLGATTLAMALFCRAYLAPATLGAGQAALFWVALAAGVLIKGPVTPMVAGLAGLALLAADRRAPWLAALRPRWGVPLALALVLPWFAAIEVATHGRFLADAAGGDLAGKVTGGDDSHGAPPGYHLLALSVALFPAGFVALRAIPATWRARREPAVRVLLAWLVPAWLVFEAAPTKLPHYPLPLYPALCLLAARWVLLGGAVPRWLRLGSGLLFVLAGLLFGAAGLALPVVAGAGRGAAARLGLPVALAAAVVVLAVLRAGADDRRALLAGLCSVPLLWWAALGWSLPQTAPLWLSARIARVAQGRTLAAVGYAEPSLRFEAGTATQFLDAAAAARFYDAAPGRAVAVAAAAAAEFLRDAAPIRPQPVAALRGFDYSNGRRMTITVYARR